MFHDVLLTEVSPFDVQIFQGCDFDLNVHHEIEIIYCLKGSFSITIDTQNYTVNQNNFVIITPMLPHAAHHISDISVCILKIGPILLRSAFLQFSEMHFDNPVFSLRNPQHEWEIKTKKLLDEIVKNCIDTTPISELIKFGNLYKLCATIISDFPNNRKLTPHPYQSYVRLKNIEKTLEYIHFYYMDAITVEKAAEASGYSKGHFCKIFKETIGCSFHYYLNNYRIKKAMFLLSNTNIPVGELSAMVGFPETKTFCRLFKKSTGLTPTDYRNHFN